MERYLWRTNSLCIYVIHHIMMAWQSQKTTPKGTCSSVHVWGIIRIQCSFFFSYINKKPENCNQNSHHFFSLLCFLFYLFTWRKKENSKQNLNSHSSGISSTQVHFLILSTRRKKEEGKPQNPNTNDNDSIKEKKDDVMVCVGMTMHCI